MSTYKDLSQRSYYKIFTGSNQTDGHEKIHLGYEGDTFEIILKKDKTTYFHVPFFTTTQRLVDSTLIAEGAIPGAIPAMADRIFKKQADYGKNTPWGNTNEIVYGTWLCSWLYAGPDGKPQWLDRYFDPGRLSIAEALEQDVSIFNYVKSDPVFYDVPSQMTLEPGVWYQYFHQGEKSNQQIVSTFTGVSGNKIKLDIDDWSANTLDKSQYNNSVIIENYNSNWIKNVYDPGYIDRNVLNFNNNSFINCYVPYKDSYNLLNEFSLQFWFYNDNWKNAPFTQIVGNLSLGGYGVYYDNLKAFPYYAIPETTYGHLFFVNQNTEIYTEKNIQKSAQEYILPIFSGLNSEFETIVVDLSSQKIYKYNHLGDVLTQSKATNGDFYTLVGTPKTAIIDGSNNTYVLTTSGTYIFNQDLVLIQELFSSPYIQNEVLAFDLSGNLIRERNSLDVKFDNTNNKWSIKTDGKLYCNDVSVVFPGISATNLAIDPNGTIWVLADVNDVYLYNPELKTVVKQFKVGIETAFTNNKNVTFIYEYDRNKGIKSWYAIIIHSYDKAIYKVNLDGDVVKSIFIPEKLNIQYPLTVGQDARKLSFNCKGDFTGYEWKRIFNKVLYNNEPQLQFKIAVDKPISKSITTTNTWIASAYFTSVLGGSNPRDCSPEVKDTKTFTVPENITLPAAATVTWSADDDIAINGERLGGGCFANSGTKQMTINSRTIQVDLIDTVGVNWGGEVNIEIPFNATAVVPDTAPVLRSNLSKITLSTSTKELVNNTWYLVTCTFKNNVMKIFIDDSLRNSKKIPDSYDLVYNYKTNFYIGTPSGKIENLNIETGSNSLIWDGYIDTIRVYDYALESFTTQNRFSSPLANTINTRLQAFVRAKIMAQDLIWSIPTAPLEYIDTIDRFFKHRLPGSKSPFFNIKLSGLKVTDPVIRNRIENEIKAVIARTRPAYTKLLNVEWLD